MARRDGDLVPGITAYADGPEEMRQVINHHVKLGVDNIKLSMSGEEITETRSAQDCYFSDEETAACVDEAHKHGKRLCAHARARDSVKMCVRHGVDVIFHASYIDDEGSCHAPYASIIFCNPRSSAVSISLISYQGWICSPHTKRGTLSLPL